MRKRFTVVCVMLASSLAVSVPVLAADTASQSVDGFLYAKLRAVGTRAKGPGEFLQTFDDEEFPIVTHTMMWQTDQVLQTHLGRGDRKRCDAGDVLYYAAIRPYEPKFPRL